MASFTHLPVIQCWRFNSQGSLVPNQRLNQSTIQLFILILVTLPFLIFFVQYAHSGAVTLAWDPNSPSENVAGYRLYVGAASRDYTTVIDITEGTLKKVSKLAKGQHYYFAVTAYNEAGQESNFSEELVVNTCTYRLSPSRKTFKPEGGISTVKVITQPNCDWSAISNADWLTIMEGESGMGPGVITFSVEPNSMPEKREAGLSFAGRTFKATQKGATLP